ncbi:MAG: methyltransferase domain-containing protein [Iphinoe sp. HA4291-MV1]|jgi:predicted SAM-dependent methyltransferase|nr:methyltransferase domain-containing protein [Iphinoe sp. HA4291-MV1]
MQKLNLGCGDKYLADWINIDFNSKHSDVIPHNLLQPLPFPDNSLDVVYSSHVLEHFSREEGERLIRECFRILKPNGILRIVVPDLEQTCREYLRIMDIIDSEEARKQYEWIIIELLDQMVRTKAGGLMKDYWRQILENDDELSMNYVEARTGVKVRKEVDCSQNRSIIQKILDINTNKLKNKFTYVYITLIKKLIPRYIRQAIGDNTPLGEKHKWMYDHYSLRQLFEKAGLTNVMFFDAHTSLIPDFSNALLDINTDGSPYKAGSLYCDGMKPPNK